MSEQAVVMVFYPQSGAAFPHNVDVFGPLSLEAAEQVADKIRIDDLTDAVLNEDETLTTVSVLRCQPVPREYQ